MRVGSSKKTFYALKVVPLSKKWITLKGWTFFYIKKSFLENCLKNLINNKNCNISHSLQSPKMNFPSFHSSTLKAIYNLFSFILILLFLMLQKWKKRTCTHTRVKSSCIDRCMCNAVCYLFWCFTLQWTFIGIWAKLSMTKIIISRERKRENGMRGRGNCVWVVIYLVGWQCNKLIHALNGIYIYHAVYPSHKYLKKFANVWPNSENCEIICLVASDTQHFFDSNA